MVDILFAVLMFVIIVGAVVANERRHRKAVQFSEFRRVLETLSKEMK